VTQRPAEHFAELLRSFETAMLVTLTREGQLRARPMTIASVNDEGDVWLAAELESERSADMFTGRPVAVVVQNAKRFVSVSGTTESHQLGRLHVRATDARFWDLEGHRGFVYLFGAVRQAVRGESAGHAKHDDREHVHLRQDDSDRRPTLTGWLKSHLHVSSRRARSQ
jgi:hypothetical protein